MLFSRAAAYAACASWLGVGLAHNIALKAHTRECFHEELHRDDKMTVTFQVGDREFGGAGNLEIDFYVSLLFLPRTAAQTQRLTRGSRSPTLPAHTKPN